MAAPPLFTPRTPTRRKRDRRFESCSLHRRVTNETWAAKWKRDPRKLGPPRAFFAVFGLASTQFRLRPRWRGATGGELQRGGKIMLAINLLLTICD
jgi:hypothetical protein